MFIKAVVKKHDTDSQSNCLSIRARFFEKQDGDIPTPQPGRVFRPGMQTTAVESTSVFAGLQPWLKRSYGTHMPWRKTGSACLAGISRILPFSFVLSGFAILEFLRVTQLKLPSLHIISALQININLQESVFRFINNGWVAAPLECLFSASKRIRVSCTEETSWSA